MGQTFSPDLLINQATGEIDPVYLARAAQMLARDHYGADCTEFDIAYYAEKLNGRAYIMRQRRRAELGLPDDQIYTMITPYGRQVEGVRRSAF